MPAVDMTRSEISAAFQQTVYKQSHTGKCGANILRVKDAGDHEKIDGVRFDNRGEVENGRCIK